MVNDSININKVKNYLSSPILKHKNDHDSANVIPGHILNVDKTRFVYTESFTETYLSICLGLG